MTAPSVTVIEGADATGKTTVARSLVGPRGHVVHNGRPPRGSTRRSLRDTYLSQLELAVHLRDVAGESTAVDRSFLGEMVYGAARASGPLLTWGDVRGLERWCRRNGVRLLGMTADAHTRLDRHIDRGEPFGLLEVWTAVDYDRYFSSRRGLRYWETADTSAPTPIYTED